MTRKESIRELSKYPEMVEYCKKSLFSNSCIEDCIYYATCKGLDYTDKYGTFPIYPGYANEVQPCS